MRIRAGSYRVCSRIDEGERLILVITINTGNDVRDTVKRCLDRALHGERRMYFGCTGTEPADNNAAGGASVRTHPPTPKISVRRRTSRGRPDESDCDL